MKIKIGMLLVCLFTAAAIFAQENGGKKFDRSQLSFMVVPYASYGTDSLATVHMNAGFEAARSEINSVLISRGYKNTADVKLSGFLADERSMLTQSKTSFDDIKAALEKAPADVLIQVDVVWIDPPGNPRNRQAQLWLKAIDRYNGIIYADKASLQSKQREYPDLQTAVKNAVRLDAAVEFQSFIQQLEASYASVLAEGRMMNVKFELGKGSDVDLSSRIDGDLLSDKIEEFISKNSYKGQFRSIASYDTYMDFTVQVPLIDESGRSVSPNQYLNKKVNEYFYKSGLDVKCIVQKSWINFVLIKKATINK